MQKVKAALGKLNKLERVMLVLACAIVFSFFAGLLISWQPFHHTVYLVWCLFSCLFLTDLFIRIVKKAGVKPELWSVVIPGGFFPLLVFGASVWTVCKSDTVYVWDYANYYNLMVDYVQKFDIGLWRGFKGIAGSVYRSDYATMICSFIGLPFAFTDQSIKSFMYSYFLVGTIPMIAAYVLLAGKLCDRVQLSGKGKAAAVWLCGAVVAGTPLLHAASIIGQPDNIGNLFLVFILLLTLDYRFEEKDGERLMLLFLSTVFLVLTRRWYLYWCLGFYVIYTLLVLIPAARAYGQGGKAVIRRFLGFGIISVLVVGVFLFPMIRHILTYDYGSRYAYYFNGGFTRELGNQLSLVGFLPMGLAGLGLIAGILRKRLWETAATMLATGMIGLVLFTRIQNMGLHQSLIMVPTYLVLTFLLIICMMEWRAKLLKIVVSVGVLAVMAANLQYTMDGCPPRKTSFLVSDAKLNPGFRVDMDQIREVISFVTEHCQEGEYAAVMSATSEYCADTFGNYESPGTYGAYFPDEASVAGTHGFPTDYLGCKYLFLTTQDPEEVEDKAYSVIEPFTRHFLEDKEINGKFRYVREFKMTDQMIFYVYERIVAADRAEAQNMLQVYEEYNEQWPELFEQKIERWFALQEE